MYNLGTLILSTFPFAVGVFIYILTLHKYTVLRHELGHAKAIKKCARKHGLESLSTCRVRIKRSGIDTFGFTESQYLKHLEDNKANCTDDIKYIARAGILASVVYIPLFLLSLVITIIVPPLSILLGISLIPAMSPISYILSYKPLGDRYYNNHPENFSYSAGLTNYNKRAGKEVIDRLI